MLIDHTPDRLVNLANINRAWIDGPVILGVGWKPVWTLGSKKSIIISDSLGRVGTILRLKDEPPYFKADRKWVFHNNFFNLRRIYANFSYVTQDEMDAELHELKLSTSSGTILWDRGTKMEMQAALGKLKTDYNYS